MSFDNFNFDAMSEERERATREHIRRQQLLRDAAATNARPARVHRVSNWAGAALVNLGRRLQVETVASTGVTSESNSTDIAVGA